VANPPGLHGEHVRIAVIDTGVDYTHANFGGPGTVAAFDAAFANSTLPPIRSCSAPKRPKVKGGIDLVGDAYDANVAAACRFPTRIRSTATAMAAIRRERQPVSA